MSNIDLHLQDEGANEMTEKRKTRSDKLTPRQREAAKARRREYHRLYGRVRRNSKQGLFVVYDQAGDVWKQSHNGSWGAFSLAKVYQSEAYARNAAKLTGRVCVYLPWFDDEEKTLASLGAS